ncbi:YhgE/Pip family protein [Mycobacterium vicinigordonae]|uniref:ABC transporter permease n=1 Tax=Mycobacterium vicinigordonae TaxID=1719132 RepID=A0A7D6I102_9MYCO|nr:YhgE/Pip family protein [Mycobacterium vicinigordonae]QLL07534.1 ABC transporter permease [Mycobacterium vicinigordonae]
MNSTDLRVRPTPPDAATWRTWASLIVLPVLVLTLFLWAFWSPQTNHGAATAAVVNDDHPVTIDGQTLPLGRQLAANLITAHAAYSWVLTDAADARNGLARGRYGAVVYIPSDFSAKATSSASPNPLAAGQAQIRVQTSNATGVADPLVSTQIAEVILHTLNQQIVKTYLDKVYLSFSTIHDQLDHAASGATQLADGADQLSTGATQLSTGTAQLAGGLNDAEAKLNDARAAVNGLQHQLQVPPPPSGGPLSQIERLAAGLDSAAVGATKVNDGAHQLDSGLRQLSSGAHQLAEQLARGRDQVPSYDQAQRERLTNVAATPAVALTDTTDLGAAVAAVGVTLALWSAALATYIITRALPAAVLTSRESTRAIVARAAAPGVAVALTAAAVVTAILLSVLHLSPTRWCALLGVTALAALTFTALNQAATAILRRPGRFLCITVLVLAIVTNLTSTIPATLHTLGSYLPTHAAVLALRGVITGSDSVGGGIGQLMAWLIGAAAATLLITEHRRALSSAQLQLGRNTPPLA